MASSLSGNAEFSGSSSTAAPSNPDSNPSAPPSVAQDYAFKNCWSCRFLSGSALLGAGAYVALLAKRPMRRGTSPSPGSIAQMVFGISVACWGIILMADPKKKSHPVV